jgi:internalin A
MSRSFKSLTTLGLSDKKVTDTGLKEFKNLTLLDLAGTQVTDPGAKELEKALPKCFIARH